MKSLKESILDDDSELLDKSNDDLYKNKIKDFLYKYYRVMGRDFRERTSGVYDIKNINGKYVVTINKNIGEHLLISINHTDEIISLNNNELFEFGPMPIDTMFDCKYCSKLISLNGIPKNVISVNCSYCDNLTSLEGAPQKCNEFYCCSCNNLTSLEGAPKKCNIFNCKYCIKLVSLKGAPKECFTIDCSGCDNLTSLKGSPKVCDRFLCSDCKNLTSLEGITKQIGKQLILDKSGKEFSNDEIQKFTMIINKYTY